MKNQKADAPDSSSSSPDFFTDDLPQSDSFSAPSGSAPAFPTEPPPPESFALIHGDAASVWEIIRKEWNSHNCRFTCDKIYLNLSPAQRERVSGSLATFTPERMVRAIRKYFAERKEKPSGYEYKSFYLFVEKGLEFYADEE